MGHLRAERFVFIRQRYDSSPDEHAAYTSRVTPNSFFFSQSSSVYLVVNSNTDATTWGTLHGGVLRAESLTVHTTWIEKWGGKSRRPGISRSWSICSFGRSIVRSFGPCLLASFLPFFLHTEPDFLRRVVRKPEPLLRIPSDLRRISNLLQVAPHLHVLPQQKRLGKNQTQENNDGDVHVQIYTGLLACKPKQKIHA